MSTIDDIQVYGGLFWFKIIYFFKKRAKIGSLKFYLVAEDSDNKLVSGNFFSSGTNIFVADVSPARFIPWRQSFRAKKLVGAKHSATKSIFWLPKVYNG